MKVLIRINRKLHEIGTPVTLYIKSDHDAIAGITASTESEQHEQNRLIRRFREALQKENWTLTRFWRTCGLPQSSVSNWMRGMPYKKVRQEVEEFLKWSDLPKSSRPLMSKFESSISV